MTIEWAAAPGMLGYLFGHTMELIIDEIKQYELSIMTGLQVFAIFLYAIRRYRINKKKLRRMIPCQYPVKLKGIRKIYGRSRKP